MANKVNDPALWAALAGAAARSKQEGMPEEVQHGLQQLLQQEPDAVRKQVLEGTGIDLATFGQQRSKEELLSSHNQALHHLKSEMLHNHYQLNVTCARDVKSAADFPVPPPLTECTPINIHSLQLRVTHKGRVLRGKLLPEKPVVYTAAQELLEDENGDAVRVSLYNLIPEFETWMEKQMYAEKILWQGMPIAIIEPYYKVAADGSQVVRVDNPAEVVFLNSIKPQSAEEWQAEAKRHFVGSQYEEALRCYAEALCVVPGGSSSSSSSSRKSKPKAGAKGGSVRDPTEPGLLVSLLLNISACALQLDQPSVALQYAAAAAAIQPSTPKPYYRAALALDAGGHAGAAEWFMLESARLSAGAQLTSEKQSTATDAASKSAAHLLPQLKQHSKAQASSSSTLSQSQAATLMQQHVSRGPAAGAKSQMQALRVIASAQGEPHPNALWGKDSEDTSARSASNRSDAAGHGKESDQDRTSRGEASGKAVQDRGAARTGAKQHAHPAESVAQKKKDEGNQLYRNQEWQQAALLYDEALAELAAYPALLLSNSAACLLNLSNNQQAVQTAAAATLLDPTNVKAAYRCITALLGLEWLEEAGKACGQALRMHPEEASLKGLQQRVSSAAAATKATSAAKATPTAGGGKQQAQPSKGWMSEREMHKQRQENAASTQSWAVMNDMMAMLPAAQQAQKSKEMGMDIGVDMRIPPFHQEFMKSGALPAGCDQDACFEHMWHAYECARGMFTHQVALFRPKLSSMDLITAPENLVQRLQVLSEDRVKWLMNAPMGHVDFFLRPLYTPKKVHSFGNVPAKVGQPSLQPGTTHVAVGFLDLGTLCAACATWDLPEQQGCQHGGTSTGKAGVRGRRDKGVERCGNVKEPTSVSSGGGLVGSSCSGSGSMQQAGGSGQLPVLRWVGFDSSPGCVAQSLVVAQMLKMGTQVDHVLQVWISAAWSRATLTAFRTALTALLTTAETAQVSPDSSSSSQHTWEQVLPLPVQQVLRHWQLHDVSLRESRMRWLDNSDKTDAYVANFVRKEHRIAMWKYLLTGQVLHGEVGSVTMSADPDPELERCMSESFLQTLPFEELHRFMEECGLDPVQAGVEILRARLSRLAQAIHLGLVDIQLRLGTVASENKPLLEHIAALRPDTMSWSNVPDYITPPSRFHTIAAACSSPSTVHYMHSMNWPCSVKGACHMDMQIEDPEGAPEVLKRLLAVSKQDIQRKYKDLGAIKYLLCPPVDNVRNTVDFQLFLRHYKDWVRAFFSEGRHQGLRDVEKQVSVEHPEYNILSRSNSNIGITFTYSRDRAVLQKLQS